MRPPNWAHKNCECLSAGKQRKEKGWLSILPLCRMSSSPKGISRPSDELNLLTNRQNEGTFFSTFCFLLDSLVLPWSVYQALGDHSDLTASSPARSVYMNSSTSWLCWTVAPFLELRLFSNVPDTEAFQWTTENLLQSALLTHFLSAIRCSENITWCTNWKQISWF